MKIYRNFINGLFPKVCCVCNKDLINEFYTNNKQLNRLCEECRLDLLQQTGLKRFHLNVGQLTKNQKLGEFFYFWNFRNETESLIKKYKLARNYRLAGFFAEFVFICLRNFNILDSEPASKLQAWDFICPVPSAPSSIRRKRFNHTQMLAKALSKKIQIPCSASLLVAARERKNQSELNKSLRIKNVVGAFSANKQLVAGRKILLIDDIITTGATAAECCKTLYASGARQVDVITLAKRELYEI